MCLVVTPHLNLAEPSVLNTSLFSCVQYIRLLEECIFIEHSHFLGGEGEIRTPETLAGLTLFESAPFNHSGTSPRDSLLILLFQNTNKKQTDAPEDDASEI